MQPQDTVHQYDLGYKLSLINGKKVQIPSLPIHWDMYLYKNAMDPVASELVRK